MKDESKTKKQLVSELNELRHYVAGLQSVEEELTQVKESQQKFTKAFMQNSIPMGITTLKEGMFVEVSDVFLKLMGLERDKVIGNTSTGIGFITKEQRTIFFNELNKKGRVENLELQVRTKGGESRYGLFNAVMMTLGNEKYLHTVMTDITDRTRLEEQILIANERLHYLLSGTSAVIYTAKPNDDYGATFISENVSQLTGYKPDEILATSSFWLDHVHPDDVERILAELPSIFEGNFHNYEYRFLHKDGRYIWVRDEMKLVRNAIGEPLEIIGYWIDITVRKEIEKNLKISESQFRTLIESIPIGIFTYEGSKFRYLNPACEKITGYTREELYQKDFWETIHPDFKNRAREYVHKRQRGEPVPERFELKFITKSGEVRWGERGAITIEQKENPLVLVTVTDITDRKRSEESLRKSEEKYRAVLENASDAILLADEQGNLIDANRMAEVFFGYPREELLHMHYTQLHPMTEKERTIAAYKDIVTHGKGGLQKGVILRKDGMVVPVDITATAIECDGKRVLQASFRDISEHKQTEDTLGDLVRERTAELSEKNTQLVEEIKERKRADAALRKKKKDLMLHADKLQEMNAALKVLLKQREEDKRELEEKVMANVKELLLPYLEKLKTSRLDSKDKVHVSILEANLNSIISPFTHRLSSKYSGFTPREIQVANLIRQGKSTKDIAEFIGISRSAINLYRNSIRHKLGIITKKINLRSHLMSLS